MSQIKRCLIYLPSAKEVAEGNVFTPICHSVHRGACVVGVGACMVVGWGMCGRGHAWQGGTCVAGGRHAWQERWQLLWTVRILLECILVEAVAVNHYFTEKSINIT